jgi:hypothetical protein
MNSTHERRPEGMVRERGVVLALVWVVFAGCAERGPTDGERPLTATEFIEVVVELREAEGEVERTVDPDLAEAEFARRRDEILERHGVTAEGLHEFVRRNHGRPGVMASVWDSVTQRLRPAGMDGGREGIPSLGNGW